ncbi:type VI secretion system Vgr family protein [Piscirickettsia salmonis]|nr:type VI secretion system tip protein VgrG [Piscirickettsia salmonis]QNR82148.1 type VI secretion system tip protein VgrG [Piscirickettsia salmonis]WGZ72570.1 type VI secretion system tip protein VgrG [Piscirickettsia salmonis EM-90]
MNHFSGYIFNTKTLQTTAHSIRYQLELEPKLSFLKLQTHHCAYAIISIIELIEKLLAPYDIKYQLQLVNSYAVYPILHQHNESDFDFLSRYLERAGIYYYFKADNKETLVFTDHYSTHQRPNNNKTTLPYFNNQTLNIATLFPHITEFSAVSTLCPQQIKLHSYQPKQAECFATAQHHIDSTGIGEHSEYCEAVQSQSDLNNLAKLRAEEIYSKHHYFNAQSTIIDLKSGLLYSLENHPQPHYNQDYLLYEIHHFIEQAPKDNPILNSTPSTSQYHNQLIFRKNTQQYRPPLITAIPRIQGIIHAYISHDAKINPLDEQGWYQIKLGFNHQGQSWSVRKSEPYSGKNYGMHFPLQSGTEVLLSFVQGHPESPIITGSAFNSQAVNLVTEANPHDHSIKTAKHTEFTLSDHPKYAHIRLKQPGYKQYIKQQSITINNQIQKTNTPITDTQITKDEAQVGEGFGNWKYELIHGNFNNSSSNQTKNDYATYLEETPLKLHIFGGPNSKINANQQMGPGPNNLYQRNNTLITEPISAPDAQDPSALFTSIDPNQYNSEFLAVQDIVASYADLYKNQVKAEEIFGNKYELMSGNSTSIHKGNSTHKSQGNSSHTHTGNSHHNHHGDSHSSHTGNKSGSHQINSDTETELCGLVAHAGATAAHVATKNDLSHAEHHTSLSQVKALMTPLKNDLDLIGAHAKVSTGIKSSTHTGLDSAFYSGAYERVYTMTYQTTRNYSSDVVACKDDIIL